MSEEPSSILVLGTGELGAAVVHGIARHPHLGKTTLTILKRAQNAGDATLFNNLPCHIETIYVDVSTATKNELSQIFGAFHTIISCNGMFLPPSVQLKLAYAVLEAKVKRYFPWQFGVDYDVIGHHSSQNLFDVQLEVREILRAQSAVDWVIVSTGMFTSFLFEPGFGLVDEKWKVVTAIGSWDNAITVTSPKDIGRVVAELALVWPESKGVVFVAGDTVSMSRLANIVESTTGEKVERRLKTVDDLKSELRADPDNNMRKYRGVFAEGKGVSWDKAKTFNEKTGMTLETADEWALSNFVRT